MKRLVFATSLLIGCATDAEVGSDSLPVQCQPAAIGEVHGTVTPSSGGSHVFEPTTARMTLGASPVTVTLADPTIQLIVGFGCGRPIQASYAVMPVQPQTINCPLAVTGHVSGVGNNGNVFLDSTGGLLIVDEAVSCLAGRLRVDFGASGAVTGWFSVPWQ